MPEGGQLTINSYNKKDYCEIDFSDTGVGISQEQLSKLFYPLFTTKAQGMGFGLAICKRIIEAHKGTITVTSTIGKGTTFTIKLPLEHSITKEIKS
jgi:signal transduction histidine kinase